GVILRQEPVHGGDEADDFFLGDFHTPADGVRVRSVVHLSGGDEILAAEQKPGALRAAQTFATGECHEVKAHLRVIPKIRNRGNIRSSVIETRNIVLVGDANPVFAGDFAFGGVKEGGHDGFIVERFFVLVESFDFNKLDAAVAQSVVIVVTVSFLDDYFVFEAVEIGGYGKDGLLITVRHASGCSHGKRSGSTG